MKHDLIKDLTLSHIAIAVSDLDKAQSFYTSLGLKFFERREIVQDQGVETAFAQIDQSAQLELLKPHGEDGPIHQFIQKKGEGLHHLCFYVEDIKSKCQELRAQGVKLLYEKEKVGAHGDLINFIHPKSAGGVLIELAQKSKGDKA